MSKSLDAEYKTKITRADLDKQKLDTSNIVEVNESYLKALSKRTDHSRPALLPIMVIIFGVLIVTSFDIFFFGKILWTFFSNIFERFSFEQISTYFHNVFSNCF